MGSQMSKTELELNIIGHKLDDDPSPVLYIGPTKSNIDGVIEPRVQQMLRSAPSLWAKTYSGRKAHKLVKRVAGVTLRLAWAGSATELASQPAHTVLVDEVDRMEPIPGEGDVVTLAEARMATYPDGRLIIASSPTEANVEVKRHPETGIDHWKVADANDVRSAVWGLWQEGTRFEWAVPCPHCTEYFVPRFRLLQWPQNVSVTQASRGARLACPHCGALIDETAKGAMNAVGEFLAPGQRVVDGQVVGDLPESETASFWVSGLMSPWQTFAKLAAKWLRATGSGDQGRIRATINTAFGEPYSFTGEATPAAAVRALCGAYTQGEVMEGVRRLTAGVDVQKNRLVYAVRGWGEGMESWLVDYGEIHGNTDERPVWDELAHLLAREFAAGKDGGKALTIRRMGIDSGYRPGDKWRRPDNLIYDFCMKHRRAVPTKGRDRALKPITPSLIDVTLRGQVYKQGLQLWHLDTDYFKSWLQRVITQPAEQKSGRFWVPSDVTEDYCLQLTAETRVTKASGLGVWIKVRADNHYLDCEQINVALAYSLGFHRRVPRGTETASAKAPAPGPAPAQAAARPAPRQPEPSGPPRRSFVNRW